MSSIFTQFTIDYYCLRDIVIKVGKQWDYAFLDEKFYNCPFNLGGN